MNTNTFEFLCVLAKAEAENYKQKYDELKAEKQKKLDEIKQNFKPNTEFYTKAVKDAEEDFNKKVVNIQKDFSESVFDVVENVRSEELARVQSVNETKLNKMKALADVPMTADELLALADRFDVKGDYWCSRILYEIAEKNGIDNFDGYVESSYSTKLNLLDQMTGHVEEMIKNYDGRDQKDSAVRRRTLYVLFSDNVMNRFEEIWNGKYNVTSDADAVNKAFFTVYSKHSDVEKGLALANVLRNAKGERRNQLLCKFAEANISDFAIKLSGYSEEIESFKGGKASQYRNAESIIEQAGKLQNDEMRKQLVIANSDNPFLNGLITAEAKKNLVFSELVGMLPDNSVKPTEE